jgi:hypothetical protein
MLRLLTDEHTPDPVILKWAAQAGRVVVIYLPL